MEVAFKTVPPKVEIADKRKTVRKKFNLITTIVLYHFFVPLINLYLQKLSQRDEFFCSYGNKSEVNIPEY